MKTYHRPTIAYLSQLVESAKADGFRDLQLFTHGKSVVMSGMKDGALCHAHTVSRHRTPEKAAEERDRLNKTLRENMPGERAPILGGQCILSFDTGVSRVKMVIQKSNREGVNNADVLLKEVFHFGIMRHGVKPLIAMLEAQGAEYPSYQDEGLKQ